MHKNLTVFTVLIASFIVASCGEDSGSEGERNSLRDQNRELSTHKEEMRTVLDNTFGLNGSVWVYRTAFAPYSLAEKSCQDIGFRIPEKSEIAEFRKSAPDKYDAFVSTKIDGKPFIIHVKNETRNVESGVVLCTKKNK